MNTKNPATGKGVVRTRIAPTPSGFLHLGNILSFTLTAALAEKTQASTLLRIDDLDSQLINRLYVVDIFETLDFLEIPWTEGPTNYQDYQAAYSQLHRLELYNEALRQLQESGYLFACTCSRTDISSRNKKHEVPGANFPENAGYPGTCLNKNLPMNTPGCNWRLRTLAGAATSSDLNITSSMSGFVVRRNDGVDRKSTRLNSSHHCATR